MTLNLKSVVCSLLLAWTQAATGQGSASLGNGLSAAAMARGGTIVAERGSALDAVEGNPAGLAGASARILDLGGVALVAGGSFQNAVNPNAGLSGIAGAIPFAALAIPIGARHWTTFAAFTPETLVRANWHYVDAPGTAGVTYGYQTQETQIVALRSSIGAARAIGTKWSMGVTLGVVYNHNDLHAPYIFQQQPQLAGLKVLLSLSTRGYGWNGSAGVQWHPSSSVSAGLAWKSGTTIHTHGPATGSASALFKALGIATDPAFSYHAQVMNHLPQAFDAGLSWRANRHVLYAFEGDFTAWTQAFQQLPITLTQGANATINSVVGSDSFHDAVPLRWRNQGVFRGGVEVPLHESWVLAGGYSYSSNPVPSATLTPLTAAIMQNAIAAGAGWNRGRVRYDAAYQAQLPSTQSVGQSALRAGEYNHSRVKVYTQSVTVGASIEF